MKTLASIIALLLVAGCSQDANADGMQSVVAGCCQQSAPQSVYVAETVNVTTMVPVTQQVQQCVEYRRVNQCETACESSADCGARQGLFVRIRAKRAARFQRRARRMLAKNHQVTAY